MGNVLISKKFHSDIMEFQLQQMHSCDNMGKGVCITRICTCRNYSA